MEIEFDGPDEAEDIGEEQQLEAAEQSQGGEQQPEQVGDEAAPERSAEGEQEAAEGEEAETARLAPEFTPEQQKYINEHIMARSRARLGDAERRAQELEERLQSLQSEQPTQTPTDGPVIPPMPEDIWADDYEQKVAARDEAIKERAAWELQQRFQEQQTVQQQEAEAQAQLAELQTSVANYSQKAKDLGISSDELEIAGNTVSSQGMHNDVTRFILSMEKGPAVTVHLARNPAEMQRVSKMSPIDAAVYIAREIEPKVSRIVNRRKAPAQETGTLKGGGVAEKERGPRGAVYE